jgi:hypothetical protein
VEMLRSAQAARFNLWGSHGTWFWSLIYLDREGGAIGAAPSEAEALDDAYAAFERRPAQSAGPIATRAREVAGIRQERLIQMKEEFTKWQSRRFPMVTIRSPRLWS